MVAPTRPASFEDGMAVSCVEAAVDRLASPIVDEAGDGIRDESLPTFFGRGGLVENNNREVRKNRAKSFKGIK